MKINLSLVWFFKKFLDFFNHKISGTKKNINLFFVKIYLKTKHRKWRTFRNISQKHVWSLMGENNHPLTLSKLHILPTKNIFLAYSSFKPDFYSFFLWLRHMLQLLQERPKIFFCWNGINFTSFNVIIYVIYNILSQF